MTDGLQLPPDGGAGKMADDQRTWWNGETAPARRVRVVVGPSPVSTWWCAGLVGTERAAVEVCYGGRRFFLDDEDGQGWWKVTVGRGSPQVRSSSLPDSSTIVAVTDLGDE